MKLSITCRVYVLVDFEQKTCGIYSSPKLVEDFMRQSCPDIRPVISPEDPKDTFFFHSVDQQRCFTMFAYEITLEEDTNSFPSSRLVQ